MAASLCLNMQLLDRIRERHLPPSRHFEHPSLPDFDFKHLFQHIHTSHPAPPQPTPHERAHLHLATYNHAGALTNISSACCCNLHHHDLLRCHSRLSTRGTSRSLLPLFSFTAIMSRSLQDQFIDDDEEETCPLCVEEFDLQDKGFRPCPCGYQVCDLS